MLQWKSNKYCILWVCVCSLRYPDYNEHTPYYHLWSAPAIQYFPTLSKKKGHDFRKKRTLLFTKCVSIFSTNFVWKIFHSKMNWARHDQKCIKALMQSTLYYCPIDSVRKILKYEISGKSVEWEPSCSTRTDGRMDGRAGRHGEANRRFSQFSEHA